MTRNILVVAEHQKHEGLRMATGLTLLDDQVQVGIWGPIDDEDYGVAEQVEALAFAEVPVHRLSARSQEDCRVLAELLATSDRVFWL